MDNEGGGIWTSTSETRESRTSAAMTHRVDRETSIFGTELEDPKVVAWRGEGRGRGGVENVTHGLPWRLKARLAPGA